MQHDPRHTEALYTLAYHKLSQQNHHDAACLLRLMLHLAPSDERAWLGLGLCHEREGQLEMASQLYASGVLANRASGRCALACARVLDRRGLDDECRDLYEHAVEAFEQSGDDELAHAARSELEARP
jgi:tetratricopeptide (TPR) repeat protein